MSATQGIDVGGVVADLVELVRLDTQNPGPLEGACTAWLVERLRHPGIEVRRQPVAPGRENVVAAVQGRSESPRLVLLAHMDTVPVGSGWTVGPLDGEIRDGRVYGRGAADMKAGLAVAVHLLRALAEGDAPAGDVVLCATVDEEGPGMLGAHALVRDGLVRDDDQVLALEPTGLRLRIAQVGLRWLRLRVTGRMAHAGRAPLGVDANHVAARIVDRLKERVEALDVVHPLLGRPLFTCGRIEGGVATNVVPPTCTAELDLRVVPPLGPADIEAMVRRVVSDVVAEFPGASFTLEPLGVARPPVVADEGSPVVRVLREAFAGVTGAPLASGGADGHEAYTDASMIAALTGSRSCTVWGPGSTDRAHVADEWVAIDDLALACRVLEEVGRRW